MAEHGLFFALLMPPELAPREREQALRFSRSFGELHQRVDSAGPPEAMDLKQFCYDIVDEIKPFIEYKATLGDAQRNGTLRRLVWPLFFDHTRHEAERWTRRLEQLGGAESEFDRDEVVPFWANIMDEHARFVAHLLDPDEVELMKTALKTSEVFAELTPGASGSVKPSRNTRASSPTRWSRILSSTRFSVPQKRFSISRPRRRATSKQRGSRASSTLDCPTTCGAKP